MPNYYPRSLKTIKININSIQYKCNWTLFKSALLVTIKVYKNNQSLHLSNK